MPGNSKRLTQSDHGHDDVWQHKMEARAADAGHDDMGSRGPSIKMSQDELYALQGSPHNAIVFYLHLRTKMDFSTGIVGKAYGVSWGRMAALSRVQPHPGLKQVNMTIDVARGCAHRLQQRELVRITTEGRRLRFDLPMAIVDDETGLGESQPCFRISNVEIARLTGAPHGVIVLYLHLRALMTLRDGSVGIDEKVSWAYLCDLLRVSGDKGQRTQTFHVDQIRRMAKWLKKFELIDFRTEGRQLIFFLPVAHTAFHASQQPARTPTGQAATATRTTKPGVISDTDRYIEEQRQAESEKQASFPVSGSTIKSFLSPSPTVINGGPPAATPGETSQLEFAHWIHAADRMTMVGLMSGLCPLQQQQAIDRFQRDMSDNIHSGIEFFKWIVRSVRKGKLDTLSSRPPPKHRDERHQPPAESQESIERARVTALNVRQAHQRAEAKLGEHLSLLRKHSELNLKDAMTIPWSTIDPEFRQKRDEARALHGKKVGTKR